MSVSTGGFQANTSTIIFMPCFFSSSCRQSVYGQ